MSKKASADKERRFQLMRRRAFMLRMMRQRSVAAWSSGVAVAPTIFLQADFTDHNYQPWVFW
jgi:hypothetical protein